jgi:phage baseplate assembly protein W
MGFTFTLTVDPRVTPPSITPTDVAGEDISLLGGDYDTTASGDIATISGVNCAKQSAIRETVANPGSFARRPQWGAGVPGLMFKGQTVANRDRIVSRTRGRLLANPRVTRVNNVSTQINEDGALVLAIDCDVVGGPMSAETVVRPPGVT